MPRRRPGRPRRDDQRQTRELILTAATTLFARRGFDAVGMRDIATTAGVDAATVAHHTGTKAQLYDACFARVYTAERTALEHALGQARDALTTPDKALPGLHNLLDAFIDFLEAHPETTMLWLRRWLEPRRHTELDQRYANPLYQRVEQLLATATAADALTEPTPHIAVRSLVWAVHAHIVALATDPPGAGERHDFRAFAHRWLDALYGRP